jgi:membrane protein implicated in regulation of membrane protease activity
VVNAVLLAMAAIVVAAAVALAVRGSNEGRKERQQHERLAAATARVRRSPYRMTVPISDGLPMLVTLRPLQGDELSAKVRQDLVQHLSLLTKKEARRGVRLEYDGESWHVSPKKKARADNESPSPPAQPASF